MSAGFKRGRRNSDRFLKKLRKRKEERERRTARRDRREAFYA